VRIQAITVGLVDGQVDSLKGAISGDSVDFYLMKPAFPVCVVEPDRVAPVAADQTVTVHLAASGFDVSEPSEVEIALDGEPVAYSVTDNGLLATTVELPGPLEPGWYGVTARVVDSALAAECSVEVIEG
jgi:hypothetical protein